STIAKLSGGVYQLNFSTGKSTKVKGLPTKLQFKSGKDVRTVTGGNVISEFLDELSIGNAVSFGQAGSTKAPDIYKLASAMAGFGSGSMGTSHAPNQPNDFNPFILTVVG
ncbi:hypothetical protein ACPV4X_26975, partial [Vibrio owensii]|uniref:hypothetical protein n=1 Tax=Vibrio owensii TaxID=696485 RepID=UPI004068D906